MKALIIVDMQKDFMPGGALGVPGAEEVVPLINSLMSKFPLVIATKDWHSPDHMSFAVNHPGKKVGDEVIVRDIPQILWPVHCVRNTKGSELTPELDLSRIVCYFYKGTDKAIDSYSVFFDNARRGSTGLGDYLKTRNVEKIYIVGVATDYCVLYSVLDAIDLGFTVHVIADACRAINLKPSDEKNALAAMKAKGAQILTSSQAFVQE